MLNPSAAGKIHYIVVHPAPKDGEYSVFQGFEQGLLATISAFERISVLPLDVLDFGRSWDEVLVSRIKGDGCGVSPLQVDTLRNFLAIGFPFVCVCSHPDVSGEVDKIIAEADRPVHHVRIPRREAINGSTPAGISEALSPTEAADAYAELTYEALFAYVERVLVFLENEGGSMEAMAAKVRKDIGVPRSSPLPRVQIDVPMRNHFVTTPLEVALLAIGFELSDAAKPPFGVDEEYAQAIALAAGPLIERRNTLLAGSAMLRFVRPTDVILAAPGLLSRWYESKGRRFRSPTATDAGDETARFARAIATALAAQTGYAFTDVSSLEAEAIFSHGVGMGMLMYRKQEIYAFTAQLAVRAAADGIPVLRLPAGVNRTRATAARLATAARQTSTANKLRKMNRFARELSSELTSAIPTELVRVANRAGDRVKVVSDAPLEWMQVGATPLMLRADCSRIPATPGNSSFGITLGSLEQVVRLSDFDEVLIVRSYTPHDPIRNVLAGVVTKFLERAGASLRLRVVDVRNLDEFGEALHSFSGPLFVFDGHGGAGTPTSPGTIQLNGRSVDLWALRGKVRIPPIAIMSACDTHAFDGSHETAGHSLLAAGAKTVVSTTLPVDADYSALFVARLLYRIDEFFPQILRGPHGIARWSDILPGLQKMVYTTEMLRAIDGKNGIRLSDDDHLRAGFIANMYINGGEGFSWSEAATRAASSQSGLPDPLFAAAAREEEERVSLLVGQQSGSDPEDLPLYPVWLSAVLDRVAKDTGAARATIEESVREWAWITDALKYVQLGNPERILVVSDAGNESLADDL